VRWPSGRRRRLLNRSELDPPLTNRAESGGIRPKTSRARFCPGVSRSAVCRDDHCTICCTPRCPQEITLRPAQGGIRDGDRRQWEWRRHDARAEPDDRLIVARHSMVGRESPGRDARVGDPGCNAAPTRLVQRDQEIHTLAANLADQAAGCERRSGRCRRRPTAHRADLRERCVPHPASDSHAPSQRSVSGGAEESADAHAAVTSTARIGEACRCLRTSVSGWTPLRSCRHSMNRARTTSVSRGGVVKTARLDPTLGVERQLLREGRDSRRPGACVMQ
jgi:hypothetical protein